MALRQISVCLVFCLSSTMATPLPLYSSMEGSTDEEDLSSFPSILPTGYLLYENQTAPVGPVHVETDFLSRVTNFLEENMLLILVATSFVLLFLFIVCGALFMSHRRKVNAYYPSSFPTKMYVDNRDKTGGAKPFNEVPEKVVPEQESEPVDSHKQLQAEIMRAAKSLRTPTKSVNAPEGRENSKKVEEHNPVDGSKPTHESVLDQELPSFPEEKELCELSDNTADAAGGSTEQDSPEQPHPAGNDSEQLCPDGDDSEAPLIGRNLRPSSLHIHNDSATLQLIAGEKTAF